MAFYAISPEYTNLKPISTPQNIIRVQGMSRILQCRRELMAALNEATSYGYTEAEVDELYETEAAVLRGAREWVGAN